MQASPIQSYLIISRSFLVILLTVTFIQAARTITTDFACEEFKVAVSRLWPAGQGYTTCIRQALLPRTRCWCRSVLAPLPSRSCVNCRLVDGTEFRTAASLPRLR
ncbi:hypothetical protein C8R45DRAFT_568546 [Mycena sanguinolenta]|nr:hypothetical protein C8R45DRAFT_568546 [Mycena sanguinolenta]